MQVGGKMASIYSVQLEGRSFASSEDGVGSLRVEPMH